MWLSQENENQRRTQDRQPQAPQRPQKTDDSITCCFPKAARILHRSHFKNLLKHGSRLNGEALSVDFRKGRSARPRLGITISRKHGKAHDRNRFKRLLRETFRQLSATLPPSLEVNVSPRRIPAELDRLKLVTDFVKLLERIKAW